MDAQGLTSPQRKLVMWYKVKELKSKGLNCVQIAHELGVHRQTVMKYEKMADGLLDRRTMVWRHQEDLTSQESIRNLYFDRQYHIPPAAWNKLTSKDFINRHHLRFKEGQIWEDTLWLFFEMKHLRHVYIIPDVTYYYYYRPDSISYGTTAVEKSKQWCLLFDTLSANFTPGEESREAALHLDRFCYGYIRTPKGKEFRKVAKRFARALPFRQYPAQRVLSCRTTTRESRSSSGLIISSRVSNKTPDTRIICARPSC